MTTMLYQGHGSFRLTANDGTTVYVDPFAGEGYDAPADLILITHEHPDHTLTDKMPHAAGCTILRAADFQPTPGNYKQFESHGIIVSPVQAYNSYHKADECVGLVIDIDSTTFYAAGDTSATEDMESGKIAAMDIDYATFPGDGYYNMAIEEASECARMVGALHSIPVHLVPVHDASNPTIFDRAVAERFEAPGRIILEPGQSIEL